MKNILLALFVAFGISQAAVAQSSLPGEIKTELVKMAKQMDQKEDGDAAEFKSTINSFIQGAPSKEIKKKALNLLLENSTKPELKKAINELIEKL